MSLTYRFRSSSGKTIYRTIGLMVEGTETNKTIENKKVVDMYERVYQYSPKPNTPDYDYYVNVNHIIKSFFGGYGYYVYPLDQGITASGINASFLPNGVSETWTADNGIYFELVPHPTNHLYFDWTMYDKQGNEIRKRTNFLMGGNGPSSAAFYYVKNYDEFLKENKIRTGICGGYEGAPGAIVPYTRLNEQKFTVLGGVDPFLTSLLIQETPEPVEPPDENDPYNKNPDPSKPSFPDGDAGESNNGTWKDPDEPIDIPENPPFFGAGSSGFITMYSPSWYQLNQLASFLWTEEFYNQIVKLWADPMQVIMGLNILPVQIPKGPNTEIMVGNVSSGVQAPIANQQYVYADMGSVELKPFYGSYMDYAPYTKITLVLPFIGAKELVTDEVMGKVINVSYRIDILTGACIAYVKCGQSVLYQFSGNCGENIPITSASYTEMLTSYTKLAGDAAAMAVTGGGAAGGNVISSSINAIASIKPNISHTGTLASSCGAMGVLTPYIIKTKPNICMPGGQYKIEGLPSFVETAFSKCKGYTQVHSTRLQGIPATDEELEMIYNQLREGVVF